MKRFLPTFALLLLLSACVTTSSGNLTSLDSAVIGGKQITVTDPLNYVRIALGDPDSVIDNEWRYNGKTENDPSYIIYMSNDMVRNIARIDPKIEQ